MIKNENSVRNSFGVDVLEMLIDLKLEKIVKHCAMWIRIKVYLILNIYV